MQQPIDDVWLYSYAAPMYYVYYAMNLLGLCFYVSVVYYTPSVSRKLREWIPFYSLFVMIINVFPFGYWLVTLLSFRALPAGQQNSVVTQYPSVDMSLAVYFSSCLLHFVASFCTCCRAGFLGSKEDTLDYMHFKYHYPKEELANDMAVMQLELFPVDRFEEWLALQPEVGAGVPARDNFELVKRYIAERRDTFNRAIAWHNDFQCRRDFEELRLLRSSSTRMEYVCNYDKIQEMRL